MKKLIAIICTLLTLAALALLLSTWGEAQGPQPLVDDARTRPGPLWGTNSEYMIGDVAVGVVFVESNGAIDAQTENWTTAEKSAVTAEIEAGLAWWIAREPRASLTFATEYSQQPTSYEAITRPCDAKSLWIPQVLAAMGYTGTSPFTYTDDYNNDLKSRYSTDWAFTIFVVDSSADTDGRFPCGHFAFAFNGGPFLIMTYDNANSGIANMDRVVTHEIGHVFGACDQIDYPGIPGCEHTSGYLNIPNHNSDKCSWLTYPSIMKWSAAAYSPGLIDRYARGQVGWWDANCNDVLDPIDPNVETDYCLYLPIIMKE